eukprot:10348763-Alexandrium_andersonii.AAC.1
MAGGADHPATSARECRLYAKETHGDECRSHARYSPRGNYAWTETSIFASSVQGTLGGIVPDHAGKSPI